jgi:hypothetical protein
MQLNEKNATLKFLQNSLWLLSSIGIMTNYKLPIQQNQSIQTLKTSSLSSFALQIKTLSEHSQFFVVLYLLVVALGYSFKAVKGSKPSSTYRSS